MYRQESNGLSVAKCLKVLLLGVLIAIAVVGARPLYDNFGQAQLRSAYESGQDSELSQHLASLSQSKQVIAVYLDSNGIPDPELAQEYPNYLAGGGYDERSAEVVAHHTEMARQFLEQTKDTDIKLIFYDEQYINGVVDHTALINIKATYESMESASIFLQDDEMSLEEFEVIFFTTSRYSFKKGLGEKAKVLDSCDGITFISSAGQNNGDELDDYVWTKYDNCISVNSCSYDGSLRGNENKDSSRTHKMYTVPSANSSSSSALFASMVAREMASGLSRDEALRDLDGYLIAADGSPEFYGKGILSYKQLV